MRETFVLLWPQAAGVEPIVQAVESMAGRVLLSFPPHALVVLLPVERIADLRANPAVRLVSTDQIASDASVVFSGVARMAIDAWNEHLGRRQRPPPKPFEGLSWDAPGRLAPDAPAHIQEMLRRRELELLGGDG